MMAVFNFLPVFAKKNFKEATPDDVSFSLTAYEAACVFFPFVHNYTLPYMGRRNGLILNCALAALQNVMYAYLDFCPTKKEFLWAVLVTRII